MQSFHGAAFLFGGLAYLGYISLMVPATTPESSSKEDSEGDEPTEKQKARIREQLPWPLLSLLCVTLLCYLMVLPPAEEQCPGEVEDHPLEPVYPAGDAEGATPEKLLQDAHAAIDFGDDETGQVQLELCVAWRSNNSHPVPLAELKAQLECHGQLLDLGLPAKRAAGVTSSGRRILSIAEQRRSEDPRIFDDMQIEWARVAHAWLEVQYEAAIQAIRSQKSISRQNMESSSDEAAETPKASTKVEVHGIQALAAAGATASPLKGALSSSDAAFKVMESRKLDSDELDESTELLKKRAAAAVSLLGLVREARAVAAELRSFGSPEVLRRLRCPSEALSRAEALAVAEATRQAKQKSEFRHKALFALGEYWSEKVVEESAEPRADEKWVLEEKASGSYVPADVAYAESLLAAGAAADGDDKADRMAMRALRFYQHAKLLAKRHHDAAAEWRYRASAAIAVRYKRKKLAAHSLSRLAYLFIQRSRHADALKVLEEARAHGGNALSMFLETMLLRSSGSLLTDKALRSSDDILIAVAGKLPSRALEVEREALHRAGHFWRTVAATDVWRCFQAENVAHLLICVICRLLFKVEPPAASQQSSESLVVNEAAVQEEIED